MASRRGEEVVVGKVDADQADAPRAHPGREADGDVGRVLRVVQNLPAAVVGTSVPAELEAHHRRTPPPEIELGEKRLRVRLLDVAEAVGAELGARVDDDQISWVEEAADVVDSDRNEALRVGELAQRG